MNGIEGEERAERAEALARLSNACRQISGMMEAGVDILSITRVLRSQFGESDQDILRLCERIDFDLKQGRSLSDALAGEPGLFSPFAITLVRQGEERNTLPQAFARVSGALDAEHHELLQALPARLEAPNSQSKPFQEREQVLARALETPKPASDVSAPSAQANAQFELGFGSGPGAYARIERAQARWLRAASSIAAGLLAASAAAEALATLGVVSAKWQRPLSRALSAGVLALAALQARQFEAARSEPRGEARSESAPQVLEPPLEAAPQASQAQQEAEEPAEAQAFEDAPSGLPSHASPAATEAASEEAPGANAVYKGAPRDDDEEEAPRQVRRPRHEEEFD